MDGQAERQPLSVNDAAAAIESLLGDDGEMPAEREAPEELEAEASDESADEVEETETQDSDEVEAEDTEPGEVTLETIDDVAQALGVDPKDLLANLKMRVKVNGEELLVSLADAQKGHQLEADYRRKTTELAEQRKAIETEFAQRQALYQQQAVETAQMMQLAEQAIIADLNTPEMVQLRSQDPAKWLMREREAQAKLANIQQARQYAAAQWQQQQQTASSEQQRQFAAYLQAEQEALGNKVVERGVDWTPTKRQELSNFLIERYGFSPSDVSQVYNHRLVLLALDAMQATSKVAEVEKKASAVKEKLKVIPPMQKPGKQKGPLQVKQNRIAQLKGNLRKTGNLRDAAAVIESLM